MANVPRNVIYEQALRFLARREYSRYELRTKLLVKGWDLMEVNPVLEALVEQGLQNDLRFVESFIRHRRDAGYGPRRITAELAERGIYQAPTELLEENSAEWLLCLEKVHRKKFGVVKAESFKSQAQQARFLIYRGFSPEQVRGFLCKK